MHWIQFPNLTEHRRVTDEHIKALEKAKVRFKYLSRTARNGQKPKRSRS